MDNNILYLNNKIIYYNSKDKDMNFLDLKILKVFPKIIFTSTDKNYENTYELYL